MKKTVKKLLSTVMAAALALGGLALTPITAKAAEDYTAFLMFTDNDWAFGNWDSALESATTKVSSEGGSFSVTLNAAEVGGDGSTGANGAQVFCVDIEGAQAGLSADGKTFAVTDLSITTDGSAVDVDASKIKTGDIEDNGNFRIEIYNAFGAGTADDSPIGDAAAFTFADTLTVDFTLEVVDAPEEDEASAVEVSTEQTAFLMVGPVEGPIQNWDANLEAATTTVSGDGTYTVTLSAADVESDGTADVGLNVFCVDVVGLGANVPDVSAITVDALTVTADGEDVPVDISKIKFGDIEDNGNFRIEIYNAWGSGTADDSPIGDAAAFTFADTLSVEFTLSGITYGAPEGSGEEETGSAAGEVDLDAGVYNAYLGIQTPNWTYRDPWNSVNGIGSDNWGQFVINNDSGEKYGVVTDAVIEGNGTYTVSITDFGTIFADDFAAAGQDYFNLIYVDTDIPLSDSITISDVQLKIDGSTKHTDATGFLDPDEKDYIKVLIQNIWNSDKAEISYYPAPSSSLEITFTVSGFNYDNPNSGAAVEDTPEEATQPEVSGDTAPAAEESESGSNTVLIVVIVVVVVAVIAVVCGVVVSKKKKEGNKE